MSYKRLGDYIRLVEDNKNSELESTNLLGINISNNFMPSVANRNGLDLSKYKLVRKRQFATNIMHVGRDERLPVALYDDETPAIVSPAYKVFEVIDEKKLLPEFLMIEFQRAEFHRLAWYYCDSSVRGGLDWDRLCDIELPIPDDIEEQRKLVNIYQGLLDNQQCYEKSLDDLKLICDTYIENLIKTKKLEKLGEYIEQSDERNSELKVDYLKGVSTSKNLIDSKANTKGLSFHNYKIVRKGKFVYVPDTSRRGDKIALAMNNDCDCIVSAIYTTFEVIDETVLLPEFLFLFFQRSEFDRYARFNSWGSARETFDWEDMCEVKIPIPDIKVQKAIVSIFHTLESRKSLNARLKDKIKPLCPVLLRGIVENNLKEQIA